MRDTALPKVTIGIPTWNRRQYLEECLSSARAQTYANLEIVVSDNASTDGTAEYLSSVGDRRVVCLRQAQNEGAIANLNVCLRAATGEFFLLLSDDDLLEPTAIEQLVAPFIHGRGGLTPLHIGLTWSPCMLIGPHGEAKWSTAVGPAEERPIAMLTALFTGKRGPRLSSVMIRTADARRVGGYNQGRYDALCDTANWGLASLPYASVVCIAEPVVKYRVHNASHTSASAIADWQTWGERLHHDLFTAATRYATAREVRRFQRACKPLLANLTVDLLMRGMGSPGWIGRVLREMKRSWQYLFTAYTANRMLRDGWKLLR